MRNKKSLVVDQLNRKLSPFKELEKTPIPEKGWVYTIRKSLNMTLEQLGNRLKMTRQGVRSIEEREAHGSISLKTLKEVANALEMKLVYGFSPNYDSIEDLVEHKAKILARKIVLRTHQTMRLENQANSEQQIIKAIEELTQELKREMRKSIWD